MTTYVPSYLRPLSQIRTGNQSRVDEKADEVETIRNDGGELEFRQSETFDLRVNEQAYHGRQVVTSDREIRVEESVDHPERHWWIVSRCFLEELDPPLREHADIFDLLISLNLCTDDPVFFSQSPGQVVSGAYTSERGALKYQSRLSLGNFATALLGMNEIPEEIEISGDVASVYRDVREYRSKRIESDAEADIRVALHMYDDALSSDLWTAAANFYYVCENTLSPGYDEKDQVIAESTGMSVNDAESWREMVNRVKHPDKGENIEGILDQDNLAIPPLWKMRAAANSALKQTMAGLGE
ncbi:hypothetical protein [Halorussus aquaticus]|uniref:Uncharacterized protein n=1 Tax=Halorussus aquaticus TaxID=2953748 RepID=A0ABD5Q7G3_9EURY|nr:hypothetical protein [Halorussus aquaticus]